MNTTFTIKNFRIFDEDGETFDLKPLTILTGSNSSGKSSVVKGLSLLCEYFAALKEDKINGKKVVLTNHDLDFSKRPNNLLGRFNKVVNRESDSDTITFCIRVHSLMLAQDVDLELGFSVEKDAFNGVITSISIKKLDGTLIFESTKDCACRGNLYALLPDFMQFSEVITRLADCESESWAQSNVWNEILGTKPMSEEYFAKFIADTKIFLANFKKEHGRKRLHDFNKWRIYNKNVGTYKDFDKKFPKVSEIGILYYLPILDHALNNSKEKVLAFFDTQILNRKDVALCSVLKKIRAVFANSNYADFVSLYKDMETNYLTDFVCETYPISFVTINSKEKKVLPSLFTTAYTIRRQFIFYTDGNLDESSISFRLSDDDFVPESKEEAEHRQEATKRRLNDISLDFGLMFEALAILSDDYHDSVYYNGHNDDSVLDFGEYSSKTEKAFFQYVEAAIEEVVVDSTPDAIRYISSSIINVKRLYPIEADDEFTALLKRYLNAKRNMDERMNYVPGSFLNRWIDKEHFDLGHKITIDVDKEGLGITLCLHKDEDDTQGSLLADSGYGITQLFAILLNIEVAIMERTYQESVDGKYIIVNDEDVIRRFAGATLAIEEPEIHLHPNFQAKLAEMFAEAYKEYDINFIIETHSEYLIRKLQTLVLPNAKDKQIERDDISIIP